MKKGGIAVIATLIFLMIIAGAGSAYVWSQMAEAAISIHGYLALGLGVLMTLLLGGGLMFLVFYSNRKGYDDHADDPDS